MGPGGGHDDGHDLVSDRPRRPLPHLADHACGVHPGHVRRRRIALPLTVGTGAKPQVGRIHRGCLDSNAHLAGSRMRLWHVHGAELLRATEFHDPYGSHTTDLQPN